MNKESNSIKSVDSVSLAFLNDAIVTPGGWSLEEEKEAKQKMSSLPKNDGEKAVSIYDL